MPAEGGDPLNDPLKRVKVSLKVDGREELLRNMAAALQPDFKDSEDVLVDFSLDGRLKIDIQGRDLSSVLSTVGTLRRLIGVFLDVEAVVRNVAGAERDDQDGKNHLNGRGEYR